MIKAGLVYAGIPFTRTHDLNELVALLPDDYRTRRVAGALGELSDYGVETRYPDLGEPEPSAEDAQRAVTQALTVQQSMRRDLEAHGLPFPPQSRQRPPPDPERAADSPEPARDDDGRE